MPCDGGYMSEIRPPTMCGLFKPGHTPHWIQMSRATEDRENLPMLCRIIDARTDGTFVIEIEGEELVLWNHELDRLLEAVTDGHGIIEYQTHWGLVWVPISDGRYAFCVARSLQDHVLCPPQPPVGRPVQLLEIAGGFTISVDDPSMNETTQLTYGHLSNLVEDQIRQGRRIS